MKTIRPKVRYGSVIKLKPDKKEDYIELHKTVWKDVLSTLSECHITNYSIFLKDDYLFSYFEYDGDDFDKDMHHMKTDKSTQQWWELTDPCQEPLASRKDGEWWAMMDEVFHMD